MEETNSNEIGFRQANIASRAIYDLSMTPTAYKIIRFGFYLLAEQNNNKNSATDEIANTIVFTIPQFLNYLGLKKGGNQIKAIDNALNDITKARIKIEAENNQIFYNVWAYGASYKDVNNHKVIEIKFNPDLIKLMVDNINHYSWIELRTIGKMKNACSLRIYELLKSFYNTLSNKKYGNVEGEWKTSYFTIEYLREFLNAQDKYKSNADFIRSCIKKPIDEINRACEDTALNFRVDYEVSEEKFVKKIRFLGKQIITIAPHEYKYRNQDEKEAMDDRIKVELLLKDYKKKYNTKWETYKKLYIENCDNCLYKMFPDKYDHWIDISTMQYIQDTIESQPELKF